LPSQSRVAIFVSEVADITLPSDEGAIASYGDVPRTVKAQLDDDRIVLVRKWLEDLQRPADLSDSEYKSFVRYCMMFFLHAGKLWRKDPQQRHKLVATPASRMAVLRAAHDDVAHKGFLCDPLFDRIALLVASYASRYCLVYKTCRLCQLRQIRNVLIPPTVAIPAPMFAKIYTDTMHLPRSGGFKYLVQGRCSLTHYVEFRMLRKESSKALGDWLFEDVLCRWGGLTEIVTDNGPPFVKAVNYLAKKYHIHHIRISGYNSRANGIVERPHFDVRQALYKAVDGDQAKWSRAVYSIFWADRVTIRRRMGCSPYFAVTGTHPILPLDIAEATYLLPPPTAIMSTTDLIAMRAIALQKRHSHLSALHSRVMSARLQAAVRFERDHMATIRDFDFKKAILFLFAIPQSRNRSTAKCALVILDPLSSSLETKEAHTSFVN
jgi:hypothetical protein